MRAAGTFPLAVLACALANGPAWGQDTPLERLERALERCQGRSTTDLRIVCLEAELAAALLGTEARPEARRETLPPEPRESAAERASPGPARTSDSPAAVAAPEVADAERFGAAQVAARSARRSPDPGRMTARVEQAEVVPYRRLQVELDNGQVWRQIQGDTQRIAVRGGEPLTVEIWEARAGGYQMRLNELGRTIRVERLR